MLHRRGGPRHGQDALDGNPTWHARESVLCYVIGVGEACEAVGAFYMNERGVKPLGLEGVGDGGCQKRRGSRKASFRHPHGEGRGYQKRSRGGGRPP